MNEVLATLNRCHAQAEAAGRMVQVIKLSFLKAMAWYTQRNIVVVLISPLAFAPRYYTFEYFPP